MGARFFGEKSHTASGERERKEKQGNTSERDNNDNEV